MTSGPASRKVQVLLIEDSKSDANLIQEVLNDTGVEVELTWLNDGEKAQQYLSSGERPVDLILLDLNLPKVNGHQVLAYMKERGIDKTVVVITGSTSPADYQRSADGGASYYIVKPMTVEDMERTSEFLKDILLAQSSRH